MASGAESGGLIQLYTGNGRGKTSAALGAVLRAAGHGLRSHIVFIMKAGTAYGEMATLRAIPHVSFRVFGPSELLDPRTISEQDRSGPRAALAHAREQLLHGDFDLFVLDEINVACAWGLVELRDVLELLDRKPGRTEIILTGRYAPAELCARADLVTEMQEVRHPYQQGVLARPGFDW